MGHAGAIYRVVIDHEPISVPRGQLPLWWMPSPCDSLCLVPPTCVDNSCEPWVQHRTIDGCQNHCICPSVVLTVLITSKSSCVWMHKYTKYTLLRSVEVKYYSNCRSQYSTCAEMFSPVEHWELDLSPTRGMEVWLSFLCVVLYR